MFVFIDTCMWDCRCFHRTEEGVRWTSHWSSKKLWTSQYGFGELHSGPLQKLYLYLLLNSLSSPWEKKFKTDLEGGLRFILLGWEGNTSKGKWRRERKIYLWVRVSNGRLKRAKEIEMEFFMKIVSMPRMSGKTFLGLWHVFQKR